MKKILKWTLIVIVIIITLFIIYNKSIQSNLAKYENIANRNWSELFNYATQRITILNQSIENNSILSQEIAKNIENRKQYADACSDKYLYLEYELNERLLAFIDSIDTNHKATNDLKEYFVQTNDSLNQLVDLYNESAFIFNNYKYRFPNVLIAAQNNYKTKKNLFIMAFIIKILLQKNKKQ